MTTIDITTLEASVEALIKQQVAAYEAQLREALGRKLTRERPSSSRRKRARSAAKSGAPRRTSEALEALADKFIAAVESMPGETMLTLAPQLGLSAQELERPVARLRKVGRIKTVGERSRMRYYPMTARAA